MDDIRQRLGQRIRELRNATGMSQEAFAHHCGLDRTYISGVERGKRNVSVIALERIAKGLGVLLSEMFKGV